MFWLLGGFILLVIILIVRKTAIGKLKKSKSIIYNNKTNTFIYKQKPIIFEKELHSLFVFLINNQNQFILLDKINELFTSGDIQESYITINKRRDTAVNKLIFTLKTVLNKEKSEIIIERKNAKDKRVKEIKLGISVQVIE
ncbi:MAG: hypothetical protein IIC74_00975 [Bacteroidetes bacterium]|nr:hypothetical protein [Bacteroidota bacterium]